MFIQAWTPFGGAAFLAFGERRLGQSLRGQSPRQAQDGKPMR
jgi:hypothetical protein